MNRGGILTTLSLCVAMLVAVPSAGAAGDGYTASDAPGLSADGSGLRLQAIDCVSPGNCVAVGSDGTSGAIDVETAGVWAAVPLSARSGAYTSDLVSVSCPATGACVAVGTSGSQAVVERQSGSTWTGTQITGSAGVFSAAYQGSLASVDCPTTGSCEAVGQAIVINTTTGLEDTYGLIASLAPGGNGSVWSAQEAPEYYQGVPERASLAGVSCSAPGECRAVGYAVDDTTNHYQYALIDDEKNYVWAYGAAAVPDDQGGGSAGLVSISCVGDTFTCMSAGYYPRLKHGSEPMIQTTDAVDHSEVTAGLVPIEDQYASLLATSCAADGTCESVGVAYDPNTDPTYGYGYDGYIVSFTYGSPAGQSAGVIGSNTYSPGDANSVEHNEELTGASCTSGGVCVAVGYYVDGDNVEAGVIDTRTYDADGTIGSETDVRAPEPADDPSSDDQSPLFGASCTDPTHCVLVGAFTNDSNPHGVFETLGGASTPPPPPPPAPAPAVTKVSPANGPAQGGTTVTVTGTNLTGVTAVKFGSTPATSVHVVSATKLTVKAPRHASGTVDVRLSSSAGQSAVTTADRYTYVAAPVVTKVRPASGSKHGGTRVTITGHGLAGASAVEFGSTPGSKVKVISAGKLQVTSPKHSAGTVDIRVLTRGGTSATSAKDRFKYVR